MKGITLILEDDSEHIIPLPKGVNGYLILAAMRDRKHCREVEGLTDREAEFLLEVEGQLAAAVERMEEKQAAAKADSHRIPLEESEVTTQSKVD